jgi:tol-pal system protein YbgF
VVVTISAGCATQASVRQLGEDLQALKAEIGTLRQSVDDLSRRLTEAVTAAQSAQGGTEPLEARVGAIATDIERLTTRVLDVEDTIRQVREEFAARATPPPPPAPPPPAPAAPAPEPAKPAPVSTAEPTFAAGLTSFRNREYGQAVLDFLEVVTRYPSHELAAAAQYWIGEAYYLQHDYRQALVEFQRSVDWPQPNSRVADALLKSGLCYDHLRESARAQAAWRRLVREFPDSPAAEEARSLLSGKPPASPRQP